jgi:16S rRNA (cytidine1402-2'-O)-methyltransferase
MAKLIVVPTPVGNLEDITFRAVRVLKEADFILAEDTRKTSVLLKHYDIRNKMQSHHKFNEHQSVVQIVTHILQSGQCAALVSDAGTPSISDPGFLLIRECVKQGVEVECLPGATAFVPALVVSGLPDDTFSFEGFLPQKKGRQTRLKELANENRTMIFYESPHRLVKTLEQFAGYFDADRQASISRELSKQYEETIRGTLSELLAHFTQNMPRGEFVIVVEGQKEKKKTGKIISKLNYI